MRAAALVAVAYYAAVKVGFALTPSGLPISLLWPANALLTAALVLAPANQWWLLIAAVLPAHLAAEFESGVPAAMVLAWFVSNCSEALIGAGAIRLLLPPGARVFDSFRNTSLVLGCAGLLAPALSSFIDAAFVLLLGWAHGNAYWDLVRVRAASNIFAELSVVPLILAWAEARRADTRPSRAQYLEAGFVLFGLAAVAFIVFHRPDPGAARQFPALFYAPLPFILWTAVRLRPVGVSTANAILIAIATWGAVNGLGPFVGASPEASARSVQYFLIAATVPLLLLAVLLEERERVEREAREQRRQLAHLSRVATLGGLSGALAHELNQPLTAILSSAQTAERMLAEGRLEAAELEEILKDVITADRRARAVIGRLRALFKNDDARLQPLEANEVVREVLELAHGDLAMHQVRVVAQLDPLDPKVLTDPVQLQQVLLNLVVNAYEAMDGVAAETRMLTVVTSLTAARTVRISLSDRGPGVAESDMEKLFQPLYTTKPQGLGLGLCISRSIVTALGGRLWGEAVTGSGATFHLELPAEGSRLVVGRTLVQ